MTAAIGRGSLGWLLLSIWVGFVVLALSSCAGPSVLERDFGNSWAYNQEVQIANPQAEPAATPAVGLSPPVGVNVKETYNKTFTPSSGGASYTTINLSPMTTGGGK